MAHEEQLTVALALRVAPSDIERIDGLVARIPIANRNSIARAAMRIGLAALEEDPTRLFAAPPSKRGGARGK